MSTTDTQTTTWTVMSPSGYVDESVTAADAQAAIAQVQERGHTVVDVQDDTIVIADETIAEPEPAPAKPRRASRASKAAAKNAPAAIDEPKTTEHDGPADTLVATSTPTEPAAPKPDRARATRVARVEGVDDVPEGFLPAKSTPSYQQFRREVPVDSQPDWLTRCVKHGETTTADNRKAGRALGSQAQRETWCKGCKADARKRDRAAAKAEAAADATAEHDAATASE
jgi:hypothetical protein